MKCHWCGKRIWFWQKKEYLFWRWEHSKCWDARFALFEKQLTKWPFV